MRVRPLSPARRSRTQYFIAALVPALIVTLSITGFVWAQKRVTVVVDGDAQQVTSQAATVGELLVDAAVAHDGRDVVTPGEDSDVADGMTIVVRHSVPVTLDFAGERISLDVVGESVADALVAAGIDPGANPAVTPSLSTPLHPGMVITAPEVFMRVTQSEVAVPFATETRRDPSLPRGQREVVAEGQPGMKLCIFRKLVTAGVEGPAQLTAEKVVAAPVSRVVAVGTGSGKPFAAKLAKAPKGGRRIRVVATGYAAGSGGADTRTATGRRAVRGVIAVDPKMIPLGTKVYVPGYGYAIAADTGGAIKGKRVDLCFDSYREAIKWGRRAVTIIVID